MDQMSSSFPSAAATCMRHAERVAVEACRDCGRPLCGECVVSVPALGSFCWGCASHRAGLRARHHRRLHAADGPAVPAPGQAMAAAATEGTAEMRRAVRRFEAHCSDREPHPLISGLTEGLERAGADPQDVIDDEELLADLAALQERAGEHRTGHRWFWSRAR